MRVDRLNRLIKAIAAAPDEQFDITWVFSDRGGMLICPTVAEIASAGSPDKVRYDENCGTAACIAGWCGLAAETREIAETERLVRRSNDCDDPERPLRWTTRTAQEWLGISEIATDELFTPCGYSGAPSLFPRIRALRVLEHMARVYEATGEEAVRWDLFDPDGNVVVA